MNEKQLQVLMEKFATDDKLREEVLKIKDKDSMKKFINDYDKSIEIDDDQAQDLFERLQNFLKLDSDDNGDLGLDDLGAVSGGWGTFDGCGRYTRSECERIGIRVNHRFFGADTYEYDGRKISKSEALEKLNAHYRRGTRRC